MTDYLETQSYRNGYMFTLKVGVGERCVMCHVSCRDTRQLSVEHVELAPVDTSVILEYHGGIKLDTM